MSASASSDTGGPTPRAVADFLFVREGTGPAWNLEIEEVGEGWSRVAMRVTPAMLNGHGVAHGGMIFALGDSAFAYACNSRNVATVAQSVTIGFVEPVKPGERLVATAIERVLAGRSGIYAITVRGEDDRIVAEMQGLSRSLGRAVIEENSTP